MASDGWVVPAMSNLSMDRRLIRLVFYSAFERPFAPFGARGRRRSTFRPTLNTTKMANSSVYPSLQFHDAVL